MEVVRSMSFGLRGKNLLIVSMVVLAAVVAVALTSGHFFVNEHTKAQVSRTTAIAEGLKFQLEKILLLGIQVESLLGFEEQCAVSVASNPGLSEAMVISPEGIILFHNDPSQMGQPVRSTALLRPLSLGQKENVAGPDELHWTLVPVLAAGQRQVASIAVGFSNAIITQSRNQLLTRIVAVGLLILGAGLVVLYWSLSRYVLRPLSAVVGAVTEIGQGRRAFNDRLPNMGRDELGVLAAGLNEMQSQLHKRDEELAAHRSSLEEQVEGRTAELNKVCEQLQKELQVREQTEAILKQKNAELERFTYMVSHDLKSPLVTIKCYTGLIQEELLRNTGNDITSELAYVSSAADTMYTLLNDLLDMCKAGQLVVPDRLFNLEVPTQEALRSLAGLLFKSSVEVNVAPGLPTVYGDSGRLRQVMQNLVENAIRYMGSQPAPRIEIGVAETSVGQACFVKDNGIGIPVAYQEKVFGLFERLSHEGEGSGVGLALVRKIIEMHGGKVWLESEGAGCGTVVWFILPWAESSDLTPVS